jgi:hypothetical protein
MNRPNTCPECDAPVSPQFSEWFTGTVPRTCDTCGHTWTETFQRPQPADERLPAPAQELLLEDPRRFADPDPEGRYLYDDEDEP